MRRGGGIRDRARGFSRESRRNLLRRLASINRRAFRAHRGRMIFVTLTYPRVYPKDPDVCKRHLKALRKRLQREFKPFAGHFHLLLFLGPSIGSIGELRRFISSSWHEVTGKVSEGHFRTGTRVEDVKKWKQATSYVERYMATRRPSRRPGFAGSDHSHNRITLAIYTRPTDDTQDSSTHALDEALP